MKILGISGSARQMSTNTALLRGVAAAAGPGWSFDILGDVHRLPVFSPDLEDDPPQEIRDFVARVEACDGVLISSPEYVHAISGGLKNAIDWLVSGDAVIAKPIALVHASHRGEDMVDRLRLVLQTISTAFQSDTFLRFSLMKLTPEEIASTLAQPAETAAIRGFLLAFRRGAGFGLTQPPL